MRRLQRLLGGQARCAHKTQRLLIGQPIGFHKQTRKRRMRFVCRMACQCHVKRRYQLKLHANVADVVHTHLAKLDVVFRADPHRGVGVQVVPLGIKHHPVGVKVAQVTRSAVGGRVAGERHRWAGGVAPQVNETAVCIAQSVVAPAANAALAITAPARSVGPQRDAVAPVGQQVCGIQRLCARHPGVHPWQRARVQALCRCFRQGQWRQQIAWRALVQQRRHRLQPGVCHAPALHHTAQQHIGQGSNAHALVVRHAGAHHGVGVAMALPCWGIVQRFKKTISAARTQCAEPAQVGAGQRRVQLRGQHRGVWRHHQFSWWRSAQGQPRHPLWSVLVGQGLVAHCAGALRLAPWHGGVLHGPALFSQGRKACVAQCAASGFGHDKQGHQVFKH